MNAPQQSKIAVVDDDEAVLASLRCLLDLLGYDVETYSSGDAFLVEANPYQYACLIVDQRMPGITGLELIQRLRRDGVEVPALLVPSVLPSDLAEKAAALGIEVLEKPLLGDTLLAWLEETVH